MADSENTLFIRHLPSDLSTSEKVDLLCHFGAENVKVMGNRGRLKYTAFATFKDHDSAKQALVQLHQLDVLGCRLLVEFAKETQRNNFPTVDDDKRNIKRENTEAKTDETTEIPQDVSKIQLPSSDRTFTKWSLEYPRNPRLTYLYPPPNMSIISNIANAVAAYPKLYVQVLHLMNKMNLPAPFGPLTAQPPLPYEQPVTTQDYQDKQVMETSSTEESEIESDGESKKLIFGESVSKRKRPASSKTVRPQKRLKLLPDPDPPRQAPVGPVLSTKDVFEQTDSQTGLKKIQLKLPETVVLAAPAEAIPEQPVSIDNEPEEESSGFGKLEPTKKPSEDVVLSDSSLPYTVDPSKFLSTDQLQKGRIAAKEMKNFSVFKRYEEGEPTTRLYIKNLAKHTTEQDLVNIYGQYVDWKSELDRNMFDVRLMKEGRMKGQAFVTFATDEAAGRALKDSNGYVINTKPMVVQFARSAKAKD